MALQIVKAADMRREHLSWLLYGRSGAGKTTMLGTFPGPAFVLNFETERGATSLAGHPTAEIANVSTVAEVNEAIEHLVRNADRYKTFGFDSLTTFMDLRVYEALLGSGRSSEKSIPWSKWKVELRSLIARLSRLPMEKVYTAVPKVTEDQIGGSKFAGPSLPGKLVEEVPAWMDVRIWLEAVAQPNGTPIHWAFPSGNTNTVPASVRGCRAIEKMKWPTYAKLREAMGSGLWTNGQPVRPPEAKVEESETGNDNG